MSPKNLLQEKVPKSAEIKVQSYLLENLKNAPKEYIRCHKGSGLFEYVLVLSDRKTNSKLVPIYTYLKLVV